MRPHVWTEDPLVGQPALGLFADPGWQVVSAPHDTRGVGGTLPASGGTPTFAIRE